MSGAAAVICRHCKHPEPAHDGDPAKGACWEFTLPLSLEEIAARLAAASGGPWRLEHDSCDCNDGMCSHGSWPYALHGPRNVMEHIEADRVTEFAEMSDEDAALIEHAPEDIAWLIAEVQRLRALPVTPATVTPSGDPS